MSDGIDLLDVRTLREQLDALLGGDGRPRPSGSRDTEALLQDARLLMLRLSDAPETSDTATDWQAVRVTLATGDRMITCWNEAETATLIGEWAGETMDTVIVSIGEHYWASRATKHGESRLSDDPAVEGPADRRPFADLERRSREELERWTKAHPPKKRWACANCGWQNEPENATCGACDLPAGSRGTRPAIVEEYLAPDMAPRSDVMTLPPDMEDILRAAGAVASSVPSPPRFEIVLLGFPPESRSAILEALHKTLHASIADAETLIETLPARLAGGLSVSKARDFSEMLERLGASIEIRKNRA